MKARLTRINSNHENLRTDWVDGQCQELPNVGSEFILIGQALDPTLRALGAGRLIHTTEVQEVTVVKTTPPIKIRFKTVNSTYELEVQDETT